MATLQILEGPAVEPVSLSDMKTYLRVDQDFTEDDLMISGFISAARERVESFTSRSLINKTYLQCLDSFPYYTDTVMSQMAYPPSYYSLPRWSTTLWNYSQMMKLWVAPVVAVPQIAFLNAQDGQWYSLTPAIPKWYPGDVYDVGDQVRTYNQAGQTNIMQCTVPGTAGANPPAWNLSSIGAFTNESTGVQWENMGPGQDDQFLLDTQSEPGRLFPGPSQNTSVGETWTWPPVLYEPNAVQIQFIAGYGDTVASLANSGRLGMITCIEQLVANYYENREATTPLNLREIPDHLKDLLWAHCIYDLQPTRG
jgi:Phage gp6-like head-tail connector protein